MKSMPWLSAIPSRNINPLVCSALVMANSTVISLSPTLKVEGNFPVLAESAEHAARSQVQTIVVRMAEILEFEVMFSGNSDSRAR